MAGNIKVGGNTVLTHTGAVGAGTVTLKDQSGNAILTDDGTAVSMGNLRLPTTGGIKDSSGNNILTESGGVVSAGPSLALGTTSNPLTKNIVMGSGYGLDFSAAAGSAAGSSSAVLDDYEEGSWTITLHDANSGGNQSDYSTTGTYVKIGNLVTVTLNDSVTFTDYSGSPSNLASTNVLYFSLPFTPSPTKKASGSVVTSLVSFRNGADACLNPIVDVSAARGRFRAYSSGDGSSFLRPTDFNGGSIQHLTLSYFLD